MKKMIIAAALLLAATGLKAQNCEALILPYFGNDKARLDKYPVEKQDLLCLIAHAAFYESDTIPAGATQYSISEVKPLYNAIPLTRKSIIDLGTLSYYGYTFAEFQLRNANLFEVVCFATPGSKHPYLVLRSHSDMMDIANSEWFQRNNERSGHE